MTERDMRVPGETVGSTESGTTDSPTGQGGSVPIDMTMQQILAGITYRSDDDPLLPITGIAYSSDKVCPGDVFFCVVGTVSDGHAFASDAIDHGAVALVCERRLPLEVPQFIVDDSRTALASAACNAYGDPSSKLAICAVTGTNGKTTTAYLVEWGLRSVGRCTGLIGTVETRVAGRREHAIRTTPESLDLQELFARMVAAGVEDVAMEVSSHALDLGRVRGTRFSVAAFSNLTQDHLDYHVTMENYFKAKSLLFSDYGVKQAAICIDDKYGRRLVDICHDNGCDVLTCGLQGSDDMVPDVTATDIVYSASGTTYRLVTPADSFEVASPLVGRFNVENALLASAILLHRGLSPEQIGEALAASPQVPGRLERVSGRVPRDFSVLVDYCHTPDAIEKAVNVVKDITPGRTIAVFGCGGDRDATKRPKMGRAALLADYAIVTSDNPRTEDPEAIIRDILPGMAGEEDRYEVITDRRDAIVRALNLAKPGDSVLICGKGHEDYQLVGKEVLPFDDRLVASEEMDRLR